MAHHVKFTRPDVDGYGFDLIADRVVRFNKHPDGTYLNTRATYSINKLQFTHFELREIALRQQVTNPVKMDQRKPKWYLFVIAIIVVSAFLTECSFEFNNSITIDGIEK